jgi:hypothetical protein
MPNMKNILIQNGYVSLAIRVCANFRRQSAVREVCTGREVFFPFTRTILILSDILFTGYYSRAQEPALSLGVVGICESNVVSVPLKGSNLSNIGALTLFISYNDQDLAFNAIENIDPQLSGLIYNVLADPPRIALVWSKTSGASFLNAPLLTIKFNVLHKNSTLSFITGQCEIADISLPPQLVTPVYHDGFTFDAAPTFSLEPENKTVTSSSNVTFSVTSPDAAGYSWQESRSNGSSWANLAESATYTGTKSNSLSISHVSTIFNQFRYRCILDPNGCSTISRDALLVVDSISGMNTISSDKLFHLVNSPNPFSDETTITYTIPENGFVTIKIFSMTGQLMETPVSLYLIKGTHSTLKNFVTLPRGIYFCQFVFRNAARVYETNRKMIKIS